MDFKTGKNMGAWCIVKLGIMIFISGRKMPHHLLLATISVHNNVNFINSFYPLNFEL